MRRGQVPEEWFVLRDRFIDKPDPLLGPEIAAIPGRIELRIVSCDLLAVEEHFGAALGTGLIREMQTAGWQIQAAVEAASPRGHTMLETDVPFAGHGRQVASLTEHFGDGHTLVIESSSVTRQALGQPSSNRHPPDGSRCPVSKRCSRRTASPRVVELRKLRTASCQCIEMRRRDLATVGTDVRESHVVHHDDDDVGAFVGQARPSNE